VEEAEISLRILTRHAGSDRWRRRLYDGQDAGWRRLEQDTAARRGAIRIAGHERPDAIERVSRDAAAIAQAAGQLSVVDGAAAEGRLGEPARTAEFADLLENLFVHAGVSSAALDGRWSRANQLRQKTSTTNKTLGKMGKVGGQIAHPTK